MQYLQRVSSELPNKSLQWYLQRQASRGALRKRCSEKMQHIYRRTPMPKCNSIKLQSKSIEITLQYRCSPVNCLHTLRAIFPENTSGVLLLYLFFLVSCKVHQKLIRPFNAWCAPKGHTYFCSWKLQVSLSIYDLWMNTTRQSVKQNDEIRVYVYHIPLI